MNTKTFDKSKLPSCHVAEGLQCAPHRSYYKDQPVAVLDVFEAIRRHSVGAFSDEYPDEPEMAACPSAGTCGARPTANTMATVSEAMGVALPYAAGAPVPVEFRHGFCEAAGEQVMDPIARNIRPRDFVTREARENVATVVAASCGMVDPKGNLVPQGAIAVVADMSQLKISGPAICIDSDELRFEAATRGQDQESDIVVIRQERPIGGSGMSEMPTTTAATYEQGMGDKVALITGGQVSGTPEPKVSEDVLEMRNMDWRTRESGCNGEALWKYTQAAGSVCNGAVARPNGQVEVVCYADI